MSLALDSNSNPIPVLKPVSTEALAVSTTAASAAARTATTGVIRLVCDQHCFYRLDGTATTSSVFLPAEVIEYIKCGVDDTLSIILTTGTGTAYISECI